MLTLVYGTAFEVSTGDEILDHPNVRAYRAAGSAFIGDDTDDIGHVCGTDCLARVLPSGLVRTDDGRDYVDPIRRGDRFNIIDVVDFDPGDDPYVLCDACGAELVRDDDVYLAMFGRPIGG